MELENLRYFPVSFELDPVCKRYSVIVRGVKGATDGDNLQEARAMARALVIDSAAFDYEDHLIFKGAGKAELGDEVLDIGADAALKLMLRNVLVEKEVSQNELGRRLGLTKSAMSSVINPNKATRFNVLVKCFEILGRPLKISC